MLLLHLLKLSNIVTSGKHTTKINVDDERAACWQRHQQHTKGQTEVWRSRALCMPEAPVIDALLLKNTWKVLYSVL